ncbi:hypothetical protein FM036_25090 [Nostoc sp. HG1]|nr:hypothetical protein [Nostoc sp. HG1]
MRIQTESLNLPNINHTNFVRRFVTIVLTVLLIIGNGLQIPIAKADTWRGTAPFCSGSCLSGEEEVARSNCGDGACCWTGSKALCRNSAPTCQALQTNVECKAVVLICDNGFYTQTSNQPDWHSCSKYACGACLGWSSYWKPPITGSTGGGISPLSLPSLSSNGNPNIHLPNLPYGPDTCKQGFVWREAIADDHVCVRTESRSQAVDDNNNAASRRETNGGPYGPDTCKQGFVWREVVPPDHVCVTPQRRDQTRQENSQFENNRVRGSSW